MCQSNIGAITKISGGDVIEALDNENEISFTIMNNSEDGLGFIPANYFCRWEVKIDSQQEY